MSAFENTDITMGREGTVFFLLEYLNYLDQVNAELENTDKLWNIKVRTRILVVRVLLDVFPIIGAKFRVHQ